MDEVVSVYSEMEECDKPAPYRRVQIPMKAEPSSSLSSAHLQRFPFSFTFKKLRKRLTSEASRSQW